MLAFKGLGSNDFANFYESDGKPPGEIDCDVENPSLVPNVLTLSVWLVFVLLFSGDPSM